MNADSKEIVRYWNDRSTSYSNEVNDELHDKHVDAWNAAVMPIVKAHARTTSSSDFQIADLGCGPGFFEILLSKNGYHVTGVDSSPQMIEHACRNVEASGVPSLASFCEHDVSSLPFGDATFDIAISRNVTWVLSEPSRAYEEWHRILKPGGVLLVFDANWYTYLADKDIDAIRKREQTDDSILQRSEDSFASTTQERECEQIASELPLTYRKRPSWDVKTLESIGFTDVNADTAFAKDVWSEGEQRFYATSPLFKIEARK